MQSAIDFIVSNLQNLNDKQKLFSGCGDIYHFTFENKKLVAKVTAIPEIIKHPNIEQSSFSKARKLKSYSVERNFYQYVVNSMSLKVPLFHCHMNSTDYNILILEDFHDSGYTELTKYPITNDLSQNDIKRVIRWLVNFHVNSIGLEFLETVWDCGGYWHLKTRPDELNKIKSMGVYEYAHKIDQKINQCPFKTLIHGDAKAANFAKNNENEIMGFDFQYVGYGIGIQDLMLFLTSVLNQERLMCDANYYLNFYFCELEKHLILKKYIYTEDLIVSWQALWPAVWADFYRFLSGWQPSNPKINDYMLYQVNKTIDLFEKNN